MDFERAERRYFELKGRMDAGAISAAEFEAGVRELTVVDASGRTWMIGAQSGNWYYAEGGRWLAGQPKGAPVDAVQSTAPPPPVAYAPAAATGSGNRPMMLAGLLLGVIVCLGGGVAAALLLPGSPFRPSAAATTTATATATAIVPQVATPTPAPPTATPMPATATPQPATPAPIVVTATPVPATPTPFVVTATPAPATATPIYVVVTATPTVTPPPTPTRIPAPPTATIPPAPSRPALDVTMSNPHYERWGKPTSADGCTNETNATPVRRFTTQLSITNRTSQTVYLDMPNFYSNTGATLAHCVYSYAGAGTVPSGQTRIITFVSYTNTEAGDWVYRVSLSILGSTWTWTLSTDATILTYP